MTGRMEAEIMFRNERFSSYLTCHCDTCEKEHEEEVEKFLEIYEEVAKHIGFEDRRMDKRFIVKFHDVWYYMPSEFSDTSAADMLFSSFCEWEIENVDMSLEEEGVDKDLILSNTYSGHYQQFETYIPSITEDNVYSIAYDIYDNHYDEFEKCRYVDMYVKTVNILQNLEDNYMEDWIDFIEEEPEDVMPKRIKDQIKRKYYTDTIKKQLRERKNR